MTDADIVHATTSTAADAVACFPLAVEKFNYPCSIFFSSLFLHPSYFFVNSAIAHELDFQPPFVANVSTPK